MSSFKILLVVMVVFAPSLAMATWVDREGKPLPDNASRKAIGDFGANLVFIDKEKDSFNKPGASPVEADIEIVDKINRNKFLTALIIFKGCAADKQGNCQLLVKFIILQPDRRVYANLPAQEAWVGRPSPGESLQVSTGYIKVRIEDDEPLGAYTVLADVIDLVSGETLSLSSQFEAIK